MPISLEYDYDQSVRAVPLSFPFRRFEFFSNYFYGVVNVSRSQGSILFGYLTIGTGCFFFPLYLKFVNFSLASLDCIIRYFSDESFTQLLQLVAKLRFWFLKSEIGHKLSYIFFNLITENFEYGLMLPLPLLSLE